MFFCDNTGTAHTRVSCHFFRIFEGAGPQWLVNIDTLMPSNGNANAYGMPQCRAVMDDFGNLVPVTRWL